MVSKAEGSGSAMMWNDLLEAAGTSRLPGDLLIQILLRLPVVSVLRFKCVCRAWYALFDSPVFVHHHTQTAMSSAKTNNALWSLFIHTPNNKGDPMFSLLLGRLCSKPVLVSLNAPFEAGWNVAEVVGSINGLICLSLCVNGTSIVLWNPATKKHYWIPSPQLSLVSDEWVSMGFAYDEKTDCYKIIRMLHSKDFVLATRPPRVELYTTRTNAWRRVEAVDFPGLVTYKSCGNVVRGCPYWYAYEFLEEGTFTRQVLVWFDPTVDAFRFRPLPPGYAWHVKTGLGVTREPPVAYVTYHGWNMKTYNTMADIWELKLCDDTGRDPIYVGQFTVELISNMIGIVGFWGNGKIIAFDLDKKLVTYDPHSAEIEDLASCGGSLDQLPEVYDYTETLVSPAGF